MTRILRPMRPIGLWVLVGIVTLATSAAATARNPRLERIALSHADMQLASAGLLREADLAKVPPGWRPLSTTPDNSGPACPWQNYSKYTITGRAEADFQPVKVGHAGFIGSHVDVFATSTDALGRFTVDTHPGTASCEGEVLRKALGPGLTTSSARQLADPDFGEHAAAFEFVYTQAKTSPKLIYIDVIEFVQGRNVAVLDTTNFNAPGNQETRRSLARLIDERLK
jgi:hypothetical protein